MDIRYVDAHCHLQFPQYDADREEIIARMRDAAVAGIVVGCDLESSRQALALAERHEHLFASVGQHPTETDTEFETDAYHALAEHPKVIAIGECGLDYFRPMDTSEGAKQVQNASFARQIELAAELDKPLIIHARPTKGTQDAYHDIAALLREAKEQHPNLRGDMHFFAGGVPEAESFIALGFTLSFTAVITFARDYDAVIRAIPLGSILSETDAPFVAPKSRRGERNDPLAVIEVVEQITAIRGEDPGTIKNALIANARNLFGLPAGEVAATKIA